MSLLISLTELSAGSAGYYVYANTRRSTSRLPHYHDYFQISYVAKGALQHRQGTDCARLQAGEAFIIPPGFVHQVQPEHPATLQYNLAFSEELFSSDFLQSGAFRFLQELRSHYDSGAVQLQLRPVQWQSEILEMLMQCLLRQQTVPCAPELSAAPGLVGSIVSILAQCYYDSTESQPWSSRDNLHMLRRCVAYVDAHFTEDLSPDSLSRQFAISRSVLCSAFHQRTGLSLHRYISQKRIQQAQLLIRTQENMPLSEIAAQVGYEDSSTFYRNFRKLTGISPAQYRKLCAK
ncbi:MAG: helix-turn-helix transcriptional regulator [Oscillospiraceae bacterium]|nr:helix-turn-helix transcriptional regulator [Oscillospiraceae bacterium]